MNPKAEPNNPSEQGTTLAGPPGSRDNNFNLLRFLLASLVIVSHAPELVDGDRHREILTRIFHTISFGELAVDGFFLLSGFLIVQSWDRKPNLLHFTMNRVLRIYPGFLVASLISVYVVGPLGADSSRYFAQVDLSRVIRRALALLMPPGGPAFEGQPYAMVNGALWTISYEFRCYMLVAVLGLFGAVRRRWPWLPIAVASALISQVPGTLDRLPIGKLALVTGDLADMARLMAFFLVGGCFYLYRDHIRYTNRRALLSAIVVILCLFNMRSTRLALLFPGAYLLFWFAFLRSPILAHFRDYPDISYGLYLYGWPMQKLFHWYLPSLSPWWLIPLVLTSAGICGTFSWYLVEKPFLSLKRNRKRTRTDEVKPEMDVANLG